MAAANRPFQLTVLLTAIDRVSTPIRRINETVARITKPAQTAAGVLGVLGNAAGFDKLRDKVAGVGTALRGVADTASQLGRRVALGAAAAGFAMYAFLQRAVDAGDKVQKLSRRLKVPVDDLAAYEFAADRAGIASDQFSGGLDDFSKSVGQAHAGTGRLLTFLQHASPVFATQIVNAKGTAAAFGLVLRAIDKLQNPQEKAALAGAAFGDEAFINLLDDGIDGLNRQIATYRQLAGEQAKFTKGAEDLQDAETDLMAAVHGAQVALLRPLFPILTAQVQRLTGWIAANRGQVVQWGQQLAAWSQRFFSQLPGQVERFIGFVNNAMSVVRPFADLVGGIPQALALIAAVIVSGPLIGALATLTSAFVSLGVAIGFTPLGWLLLALAPIAIAVGILASKIWNLNSGLDALYKTRPRFDANGLPMYTVDSFNVPTAAPPAGFDGRGRPLVDIDQARRFQSGGPLPFAPQQLPVPAFQLPSSQILPPLPASPAPAMQLGTPTGALQTLTSRIQVDQSSLGELDRVGNQHHLEVDFRNLPQGAKVSIGKRNSAPMTLNVGRTLAEAH